jgi:gamma-glutamyl hydrolase
VCALASRSACFDDRVPLIGVLLQNGDDALAIQIPNPHDLYTYVPASYVEWLTQSGAMPVLIPYDLPVRKLDAVLEQLDGFLLPGGGTELEVNGTVTNYTLAIDHVLNYSRKLLDEDGKVFPVLGICNGMYSLFMHFAGPSILARKLNDLFVDHPIIVDEAALAASQYFGRVEREFGDAAYKNGTMFFYHNNGILLETLEDPRFKQVKEQFSVIGHSRTGPGHDGPAFVSLVEHKKYPFFGTQFHPEKLQYEKGPVYRFLDRSQATLEYAASLSYEFVDIAKANTSPLKSKPDWLRPFFSVHHVPIRSMYSDFDRIFLLPKTGDFIPLVTAKWRGQETQKEAL